MNRRSREVPPFFSAFGCRFCFCIGFRTVFGSVVRVVTITTQMLSKSADGFVYEGDEITTEIEMSTMRVNGKLELADSLVTVTDR